MPDVAFDRYYRYDDLSRLLRAFASEYPALLSIDSIGKSHEGRDIWIATLTNDATGSHGQSRIVGPDGNILTEASIFGEEAVTATLALARATRTNAPQREQPSI